MIATAFAPATTSTITTPTTRTSRLTPRRTATTTTTTTARREPLRTLDMPTSQAKARLASSSAADPFTKSTKTRRSSTRLLEKEDYVDDSTDNGGKKVNGYRHTGGKQGRSEKENVSKKRKADYDEKVGDFVFSRAEPKKPKSSTVNSVTFSEPPVMEEPENHQQQTGQKRKTRAKAGNGATASTTTARADGSPAHSKSTKRPSRKTTKQSSAEPATADDIEEPRRTRRKIDHSDPAPVKTKKKKSKVDETKDPDRMTDVEMNGSQTPRQKSGNATTIALPFADTPVISRNKEMRLGKGKGQRRSSLGMRGRRASSLIDSGASNALPHNEVGTADFYKHIGSDGLLEPRRMRQLLTWCATRAIGDKPSGSRSEDESARLAARVIQEELLKDFSNRSELSNWFSREESAPPTVVVKKPNPKNIQNAEKIKELEEQIHRLQEERQSLSALLRPPSIPSIITKPLAAPQDEQTPSTSPSTQRRKRQPQPFDLSLLHPSQHPFLNAITPATHHERDQEKQKQRPRHREPQPQQPQEEDTAPTSTTTETTSTSHLPSEVSTRLSRLATSLPTTIDAFASGIHDIELYRDAADRVAGRVLGICARRLEERDRVLGGRWDGDGDGDDEDDSGDADADGEGKGKGKARARARARTGSEEDIGLVLGALSRVERR